MSSKPVDLRDIPQISLKRIREVTQNFALTQVGDFNPSGDSDGPEYSWATISPAVLFRDNYQCRVCGEAKFERVKSEKDFNKIHFGLQVHHIIPRKDNGKSNFGNLITLCEDCHHRTFKGGYSGVPVVENSTLYDFNECVVVAVPPDMIMSDDMRSVTLKEIGRVFDQATSRYRVIRSEESSMNFVFPSISRLEFLKLFRSLAENGTVSDYMTLNGISSRRDVPVKVFTDTDGSIILW